MPSHYVFLFIININIIINNINIILFFAEAIKSDSTIRETEHSIDL